MSEAAPGAEEGTSKLAAEVNRVRKNKAKEKPREEEREREREREQKNGYVSFLSLSLLRSLSLPLSLQVWSYLTHRISSVFPITFPNGYLFVSEVGRFVLRFS